MASPPVDVPIGAIVDVQAGRGIVRFNGTTAFAPGKWVGIELAEPNGKNDGSVGGATYFSCKPSYGMFVRASQIRNMEMPTSTAMASALSCQIPF